MPVSPISNSSSSATFSQLVAILTRPLAMLHSAEAVSQLQTFLHVNFTAMVSAQQSISPFTILLSPTSLPPTPIYAACLQSGIEWPEWIRALGNQVIYILVMDGSLTVRIGESGKPTTVWSEDPIQIPAISKTAQGIDLPLLWKRRNVPRNTTASLEAHPISLPTLFPLSSSTMDVDESSSDADSDSESINSSCFSEVSSAESMTSVSSSSSPITPASDLPYVASAVIKKSSVYIPPHKLTATSSAVDSDSESIPSHRLLSRSQRRLARVTVDKSKKSVCQYIYQGGQTGVMTGGVMLGKSSLKTSHAGKPAPTGTSSGLRTTNRKDTRKRSGTVLLGPESPNWRRIRA
ncbi:hypothetical protein EV361DRAFT_302003 [Lentinula raphanica]|uniref:Anti-proliferative protein domain-containing protein n=1 Tax=Lentinula raphanica TaxID=153919 RepID=A0AA38NZH4_9AGAR|nr:hypothetical protein F5878DRAFT_409068 [Lentinula raphanica]KAJ3970134.1 hypothetical protein EV361DRAFT_302003 [Lentinula raphanica]